MPKSRTRRGSRPTSTSIVSPSTTLTTRPSKNSAAAGAASDRAGRAPAARARAGSGGRSASRRPPTPASSLHEPAPPIPSLSLVLVSPASVAAGVRPMRGRWCHRAHRSPASPAPGRPQCATLALAVGLGLALQHVLQTRLDEIQALASHDVIRARAELAGILRAVAVGVFGATGALGIAFFVASRRAHREERFPPSGLWSWGSLRVVTGPRARTLARAGDGPRRRARAALHRRCGPHVVRRERPARVPGDLGSVATIAPRSRTDPAARPLSFAAIERRDGFDRRARRARRRRGDARCSGSGGAEAMAAATLAGWQQLTAGWPWFSGQGSASDRRVLGVHAAAAPGAGAVRARRSAALRRADPWGWRITRVRGGVRAGPGPRHASPSRCSPRSSIWPQAAPRTESRSIT